MAQNSTGRLPNGLLMSVILFSGILLVLTLPPATQSTLTGELSPLPKRTIRNCLFYFDRSAITEFVLGIELFIFDKNGATLFSVDLDGK